MASSLSNLFTPGWSTSRPGDMKNPGGTPVKFAKPASSSLFPEPKPGPFTTAVQQAEIERRKRDQEKLREDFMHSVMATKARHAADDLIPATFAGLPTTATSAGATITASKLQETIESLQKLGVATPEIERMTGRINNTSSAPHVKPNPDRPQTQVDAW